MNRFWSLKHWVMRGVCLETCYGWPQRQSVSFEELSAGLVWRCTQSVLAAWVGLAVPVVMSVRCWLFWCEIVQRWDEIFPYCWHLVYALPPSVCVWGVGWGGITMFTVLHVQYECTCKLSCTVYACDSIVMHVVNRLVNSCLKTTIKCTGDMYYDLVLLL